MKQVMKKYLSPAILQRLRLTYRCLATFKEFIVGGTELRERILIRLLLHHYSSKFRREWLLSNEPPHYFNQRWTIANFAFGSGSYGPYPLYRGFFASEVIRSGDTLLDIGCGDGFFTARCLAPSCKHVDAVDVDPHAIRAARAFNNAPNITWHLIDAVNNPFPSDNYDVIVWNGAIGHFPYITTDRLLNKIAGTLHRDGVFVGSESLGIEGSDHLQFFDSIGELHKIFEPHFRYIQMRSQEYPMLMNPSTFRNEAYWRCANHMSRLEKVSWKNFW